MSTYQGNVWRIDVEKIDYGPAAPHMLAKWLAKTLSDEFSIFLDNVEVTWEIVQGKTRYITRVPSREQPIQFHDIREEFTDVGGLSSITAKLFP